ncbi:MAG: SMP-30/gluconolactonase/LRE family protein [Pseudomonadota bacterium]
MDVETVAYGLGFPEGPIWMPDGSIILVEIKSGDVSRLYDAVDGHPLKGPNDIVFDRAGKFYFTDHGKSYPRQRDYGGLFYASPDGTMVKELDHGHTSPNGVGLSPDETTVYMADTMTGRLWAFDLSAPGEINPAMPPLNKGRVVTTLPGLQYLDSLAVTAAGNICVATILNGGITTITPSGAHHHHAFPDLLTTNICFGGDDMQEAWITLSGTGQLVKTRWEEPGLKLNF